MTIIEERRWFVDEFYTRVKTKEPINNDTFQHAISALGGYVYNVCVGIMGDVSIFNGVTWMSAGNKQSYELNHEWLKRFEKMYKKLEETK